MAGVVSTATLQQQVLKLQRELNTLKTMFGVLSNRFCLYHLADHTKPPAIGILLRAYKNRDKIDVADIFVISEHLGAAQVVLEKRPVDTDSEVPRQGRWEPLILPQEEFAEQHADLLAQGKDESSSDDGNTALG